MVCVCVLQDREKGEGGEIENKDYKFTCVCVALC